MAECAFCGDDRTLTKEHVWPEWLIELLPPSKPDGRNIRVLSEGDSGGYRQKLRDEGPSGVDGTVRIVCENHCNNGWMSRLETEAKAIMEPLIFGRRAEMRLREQRLLSFWAVKTTMVLEYTDRTTRMTTTEQRRALYAGRETLALPEGTCVWIGSLARHTALTRSYSHRAAKFVRLGGGLPLEPEPERPNIQQTTLLIGRLVIVVLSTTRPADGYKLDFGETSDRLHEIAPTPRHCRWPLTLELDDESYAVLVNTLSPGPLPPMARMI